MKRTLLIIGTSLSLLLSCSKTPESGFNCRDTGAIPEVVCIAFWTYFRFTIVDEKTGADLLFGNNPTLTPGDIKLYGKQNSPYTQTQFLTDANNKRLYTMGLSGDDTMALQIKDEPLQYILVKSYCSLNEICSRTAVEILHEGKLLVADETGLFRIKY
jgi:hypothetical protein